MTVVRQREIRQEVHIITGRRVLLRPIPTIRSNRRPLTRRARCPADGKSPQDKLTRIKPIAGVTARPQASRKQRQESTRRSRA